MAASLGPHNDDSMPLNCFVCAIIIKLSSFIVACVLWLSLTRQFDVIKRIFMHCNGHVAVYARLCARAYSHLHRQQSYRLISISFVTCYMHCLAYTAFAVMISEWIIFHSSSNKEEQSVRAVVTICQFLMCAQVATKASQRYLCLHIDFAARFFFIWNKFRVSSFGCCGKHFAVAVRCGPIVYYNLLWLKQ